MIRNTKTPRRALLATSLLASGLAIAGAAHAQTTAAPSGPETVTEIIVTANRRSESVQAIGQSVSALTAESLERAAATSFFDFATAIPNLSFGAAAEGTTNSRSIAIRGIADRNTTGFYIDETPLPDSLDPKIIDVARIEVLRGPQGTLYGARSMGGTVRLITEQPKLDDPSGRLHVSLSNVRSAAHGNFMVDGALNVPLLKDRAALRIVAVHDQDAGYFTRAIGPYGAAPLKNRDNIGRSRTDGISLAGLVKLSDQLSVTPRVFYQRTRTDGFPFADVPTAAGGAQTRLQPSSLIQRRGFDVNEYSDDHWVLGTLDVRYKTPIGDIVSASSYFRRYTTNVEDQSDFIAFAFGTPLLPTQTQQDNRIEDYTQELRFSSDFSGPLQLVTGLYYDHKNTLRYYPPSYAHGLNAASGGAIGSDFIYTSSTPTLQTEYAAYAEATWSVTERLKLVGGLRAFDVETAASSRADGLVTGGPTRVPATSQSENGVIPKLSAQFRFTPDNQIYVTAAKGFRPGGVNGVVPTALGCAADLAALGRTPQSAAFYQSDSVWSYEVGSKNSFLDRRLTANVSVFRIDWSDIQQQIVLPCGFGFRGNAGSARSQGAELETTWRPVRDLTISAGVGYTDAVFTSTAAGTRFRDGDRVPQVPRYTANLSGDYRFALPRGLTGFLYADTKYVSSSTTALNAGANAQGALVQRIRPAYTIVDLRGGVELERYELALFVKNATDERASLGDSLSIAAEMPGRARVLMSQPREIGVEVRARF
uniref:TonB-dependent receptor n=1 Tax=Caulobacter sp. (strain K31) TaxID=366602 RepID=B0T9J1_CAUSK